MRRLRLAAWLVALGTWAIVVLDATRTAPSIVHERNWWLEPFLIVAILAPAAVGLLIALRHPRNAVAWVLLLGAPTAAPIAELSPSLGWALQIERATWPLLYGWPIAVAYVFPNGRLLSRRWRWVAGAAVGCFAAFMTLALLDKSRFDPPFRDVHNPVQLTVPGWIAWIWVPLWIGILGSLVGGAVAIRLRLRRSTGIERLQTMWLAWSAALVPAGLLFAGVMWPVTWLLGDAWSNAGDYILYVFLLVMQVAVALSLAVAVARYRLYAIERLISKTIVYATVTLVLAAGYVAIALLLGVWAGRGSAWVTAGATLALAVAFRPVRARVQNMVDRRFDRQRYAGLRAVDQFERDVRDGKRAPAEIGTVVARALGDSRAEIAFWLPASEAYATANDVLASLPVDDRARTEVTRDGTRTAVLLHDPSLLERPNLLNDIVRAAALSIEIARLGVELRLQLHEVEASRVRIVEAGYEERRRLERDLHDGAQQRLVSLGLHIRRMQRTLPSEARLLEPALNEIVAEIGSAIADLRQIAAGVRPARLDDGLAAALHDLARAAPISVQVEAPLERLAASVEAAAYYVACEALTNAVKHASASRVAMHAARVNGSLVLSVADDGVGGAIARRGSGLAGLRDRVAAHGGSLEIASPRGGGTTIEVSLPCES